MVEIEEKSIGEEIVKSFHEQFAQNQNHHQNLFLQVLAVLLTVLGGFGYLYIRVGVNSKDLNVTIETIYVFLALASYLLSLSIALISNMALGFRRDQLVACNIRVKSGVMAKNTDTEDDGYFIKEFNPVGKTRYLLWMPEFHVIFFASLLVVKMLLFSSLLFSSNFFVVFSWDLNTLIKISIVMVVISFAVDIYVSVAYWKKWTSYSLNAPKILQNQSVRISEKVKRGISVSEQKKEPFIRWQGRSLAYLSYAINLFLGLSVAAIGFEMSLLHDTGFILVGGLKCIFILSLLSLIVASGLGVACVLNRVNDFRDTTAIARKKSKEEYDDELDELREIVGVVGTRTRNLFNLQAWLFSIGVLLLVIDMVILYGDRLF